MTNDGTMDEMREFDDNQAETSTREKRRNLIAFWLLGLCNNFGYVVMLSAAGHILGEGSGSKDGKCKPSSAGNVLLANILPALIIKIIGPFINLKIHLQVLLVVIVDVASFVLTSSTNPDVKWIGYSGVVAGSIGSGLGEIAFLKYSSHYQTNVVSAWSSGTGMAGVAGAGAYALMILKLSDELTLRLMIAIPILLAVSFWVILEHPREPSSESHENIAESSSVCCVPSSTQSGPTLSFSQKLKLMQPLLKYMIPLGLVYFAEYFINQGLTDIITFNIYTPNTQYTWYQTCYQVGVFISRSSVNIVHIRHLWIMPILQIINAVFFTFEAFFSFIPSFWIVVVLIVYEGLLGGASYVNTFYKLSQDVAPQYKEFSMGVTSLADSTGITLAAFAAIGAHNLICDHRYPRSH
ncbi:battenin [Galendromus occidentalis]|uniref:Battenin n=1 Tax=Galendromus occidentalis TaxID=34638 RepID=A0AAJ6QMG5_9ACAR|nr:battenin [Galendromus occidentalis]